VDCYAAAAGEKLNLMFEVFYAEKRHETGRGPSMSAVVIALVVVGVLSLSVSLLDEYMLRLWLQDPCKSKNMRTNRAIWSSCSFLRPNAASNVDGEASLECCSSGSPISRMSSRSERG